MSHDTAAPMYQGTRITEAPTLYGAGGDAWRLRMLPVGQRGRRDFDATVDAFIVRAPGAHPFWDHYALSIIHLRPIDGVKPAVIRRRDATHEFMIMALNPEEALPPLDFDASARLHWLEPIDVVEQFAAVNDAAAQSIFELAVRAIVDGIASPDQDWRSWWRDAIATTAEHFADGTHDAGRPS